MIQQALGTIYRLSMLISFFMLSAQSNNPIPSAILMELCI